MMHLDLEEERPLTRLTWDLRGLVKRSRADVPEGAFKENASEWVEARLESGKMIRCERWSANISLKACENYRNPDKRSRFDIDMNAGIKLDICKGCDNWKKK